MDVFIEGVGGWETKGNKFNETFKTGFLLRDPVPHEGMKIIYDPDKLLFRSDVYFRCIFKDQLYIIF